MRKPSVKCALLAAMVAEHRWGSPIIEENLLSVAAIESSDYPTASDVCDDLRSEPYITNRGNRGIELDNSDSASWPTSSTTNVSGSASRLRSV